MWPSPKPFTVVSSMFQSLNCWSGLSWVMTLMPASWARLNTGSSALASFGTTAMTLTLRAMRSSTARTCCAASACVGPIIQASAPTSGAAFLMPTSMALNQGMPPIFTTTPTCGLSAAMVAVAASPRAAIATAITFVCLLMKRSPLSGFTTRPGRHRAGPVLACSPRSRRRGEPSRGVERAGPGRGEEELAFTISRPRRSAARRPTAPRDRRSRARRGRARGPPRRRSR